MSDERVKAADAEIESLRAQLSRARSDAKAYMHLVAEAEAENAALKAKLAEKEASWDQMFNAEEKAREELSALHQKHDDLEDQLQIYREAYLNYGDHKRSCPANERGVQHCTCGFTIAPGAPRAPHLQLVKEPGE